MWVRAIEIQDAVANPVCTGTHTATERPYLKSYFRAKLEETLNEVRQEEQLDEEPYSVIMSDEHEVEVVQFV
jgi:hypothetical protein